MRFVLTILIWIFFVGGLWVYTSQRDAVMPKVPAKAQAVEKLTGSYVLEITPTFTVAKDPFALDLDEDDSQNLGLEVRLNGRAIDVEAGQIQRGKVIRVTKKLALSQGRNEFYVKASPSMAETGLDHGVRIRLLDRGLPLVDQTFWGSGGAVVAGSVSFVPADPKEGSHDQ